MTYVVNLYKTKMELEATLRRLVCVKDLSHIKQKEAVKINRRLNYVNRQIQLQCIKSQKYYSTLNK